MKDFEFERKYVGGQGVRSNLGYLMKSVANRGGGGGGGG